jgi:Glyoxalase/Bleomycin resistance protein/Dioxygenase superfamily
MRAIPLTVLKRTTVVVPDARAAASNYADFFGITTWQVRYMTPERVERQTYRGRIPSAPPPAEGLAGEAPIPGAYGFLCATGTNPDGSLTFELIQPTSGMSTYAEFLITRGPGIHGLCATTLKADEFAALAPLLESEGVTIAQSFRDGAIDRYFLDMRVPLAEFYVEIEVSHGEGGTVAAPDEIWDLTSDVTRPRGVPAATASTGITHFGVVIERLQERLPHFARLFGEPVWRGMNWRTAPGSLEEPTNNGVPVAHAYFTGRTDLGTNPSGLPFGFEVIQPTFGPSHYKEDFLAVLGPGIHHVDVRVPMTDWDEWERTNAWLDERFGSPTCMSGWLRERSVLFCYKDTRARLGFVTELTAPRRGDAPAQRRQPDFWYDFSATVK